MIWTGIGWCYVDDSIENLRRVGEDSPDYRSKRELAKLHSTTDSKIETMGWALVDGKWEYVGRP